MKKGEWTQEEDELLRKYVLKYNEKSWRKISDNIPNRNLIQCYERWNRCLKPGLAKGAWTKSEDNKLLQWVRENGVGNWAKAAKRIRGRTTEQCRERWFNVLSPDIKKGHWTKEEDELLLSAFKKVGPSWKLIATSIPGRTPDSTKCRYHSILRRLSKSAKDKVSASPMLGANELEENEGKIELNKFPIESFVKQKQISFSPKTSNILDILEGAIQDNSCKKEIFEKEFLKKQENTSSQWSSCYQSKNILESTPYYSQDNVENDITNSSNEQRQHKEESSISFDNLVFEKASFTVQMLIKALDFPSIIIRECSSKTLDPTQILYNLTKLLDTFANHKIDTLILTTHSLALKNGITEEIFNIEMIRQLALEMSEALNYASQLHYDYSKNLLEQDLKGNKERPTYLFSQLSLLQKAIAQGMAQMANLQEYSCVRHENFIDQKKAIKLEEYVKDEDICGESFTRPSVVIKLGNFNLNLEQITKKRILG